MAFPNKLLGLATPSRTGSSSDFYASTSNYGERRYILATTIALKNYTSSYFIGPNFYAYKWIAVGH